jgi:predicted  nucleic acid-binding Zn-ribbon protein
LEFKENHDPLQYCCQPLPEAKLNEQLKFLIELQEIDSSILSVAEKTEALPEKLKQFRKPFQEADEAFRKAKSKFEALEKKKKDKDLKLDEIQDMIDKMKSRSGDIKTNKEYDAHLKEIEGFGKSISAVEDEILSLMEEIEEYKKTLKEEESRVNKVKDDLACQEKVIEEEKKELFSGIEDRKAKRKQIADRISEDNYKHYKNLLERYGGLAVVQTKNEICFGCNTNIPPQLYNDIKKDEDIYTCFYCKRFLYFRETSPAGNKPQENQPSA